MLSSPTLASNLIGELFEQTSSQHRLLVLDMGYPSPTTVKFFNQYKCRLNFLDLINSEFLSACPTEADHSVLVDYFRAGLDIQPEVIIDICLFWDFFNYLDRRSLSAFMQALAPHINSQSRGYCLGVLSARNQLPYCQYGIESRASLSQIPLAGHRSQLWTHTQRDLSELLSDFEVDKSRLMPDGRVEYLLAKNVLPRQSKPVIF